jgi:hypothetical protein
MAYSGICSEIKKAEIPRKLSHPVASRHGLAEESLFSWKR